MTRTMSIIAKVAAYLEVLGALYRALQWVPKLKAEIKRCLKPKPPVGETNGEWIGKPVPDIRYLRLNRSEKLEGVLGFYDGRPVVSAYVDDGIRAPLAHPAQHKDEIDKKLTSIKWAAAKGSACG